MFKHIRFFMLLMIIISAVMMAAFTATGYVIFAMLKLTPENGWRINPRFMQLIGFTSAAVVVAVFVLSYITRRYFKPIENLADAMNKVAEGNFDIELPVGGGGAEIDKMNLNFNKMVKELRSTETLQSDFVQNVSHEFKTPLASIKGYAVLLDDMASELPDSVKAKEYTERIIHSSDALSALAGNILSLSKLENQHIVSEKKTFSLDEQIRQAYLSLEPLWGKRDIEIDMDLPELNYTGNENLMFQIWTNLFSNAIKFTPDKGSISVAIKENAKEQGDISVTVRDTGIGMSEEEQEHMFDRFYQAETNRSKSGNGLGLTLVKKITELCGGHIAVESAPGKGAAFTVWLPPVKLL